LTIAFAFAAEMEGNVRYKKSWKHAGWFAYSWGSTPWI